MINKKQHTSAFINLVDKIKFQIKELTVANLNKKINSQHEFYLIDVREHDEFQQGSIAPAIHLSKGVIERDIEKYIPDLEAQIIVYWWVSVLLSSR